MHHEVALTVALALAAGMAVQLIARSIKVPAIILLLATGVALGPTGLGWVEPDALGDGLFVVVDFGVAIILFEGALNLKIRRLRREERVIRRLVTWSAIVTLVGGAIAARVWLDWPWTLALLFGSLVVVTGPTVVGPLVRDLRLQPRLKTVLEAEGVLIDPIGALLAVLVLQITLQPDALSVVGEFGALLGRLAVGVLIGAVGGLIIGGLLRLPALVHGFENALTLALVVALFHLSDFVLAPSGLLAVTVAGLVVGNMKTPVDEDLREFKDQLTVLMIGALFVLLAADIGLAAVTALGWSGVAVLATLVFVVRPAGVWLATVGTGMQAKEVVFVSAIAPRGIVAAAIASLTAGILDAGGIAGGTELRALVFLVIAGTVIFAGAAAWPLASVLRAAAARAQPGGDPRRAGSRHRARPAVEGCRADRGLHRCRPAALPQGGRRRLPRRLRRRAQRADAPPHPDRAGRHRDRRHLQRQSEQPVRPAGPPFVRRQSRPRLRGRLRRRGPTPARASPGRRRAL